MVLGFPLLLIVVHLLLISIKVLGILKIILFISFTLFLLLLWPSAVLWCGFAICFYLFLMGFLL